MNFFEGFKKFFISKARRLASDTQTHKTLKTVIVAKSVLYKIISRKDAISNE